MFFDKIVINGNDLENVPADMHTLAELGLDEESAKQELLKLAKKDALVKLMALHNEMLGKIANYPLQMEGLTWPRKVFFATASDDNLTDHQKSLKAKLPPAYWDKVLEKVAQNDAAWIKAEGLKIAGEQRIAAVTDPADYAPLLAEMQSIADQALLDYQKEMAGNG